MLDSAKVRRLADSLASVRGDSLRAYWRAYWRARRLPAATDPLVQAPAVQAGVLVVDSSDADSGDDAAMRTSVIAYEACSVALDSNRGAVHFLVPAYQGMAESLATERAKIPYKPIAVSGGIGLGLGYILGKIF